MNPATQTPADRLASWLQALATSESLYAIEDAREDLYPVHIDPTTGALRVTEDN